MKQRMYRSAGALAVIGALAAAAPAVAQAEGAGTDWQYTTTIYGWLPSLDGSMTVPPDSGGATVEVDPSKILDALNFTIMAMGEAKKGRWGIGADLIYLDLGGSKKKAEDFTVGGNDLPAGVTARADLGIRGWLLTVDGTYYLSESPDRPVAVIAGARMLDLSADLDWHLDGNIAGLPLPGRDGKGEVGGTVWDAIVGIKGRLAFGEDRKWFIPYYADVGTGDSDVTWQAFGGLGYAFDWGDLVAVWRYLDYSMPSSYDLEELNLEGAAIGVTFRF
jgi:hypothetical protein